MAVNHGTECGNIFSFFLNAPLQFHVMGRMNLFHRLGYPNEISHTLLMAASASSFIFPVYLPTPSGTPQSIYRMNSDPTDPTVQESAIAPLCTRSQLYPLARFENFL